jgi:hypothetical protein
MAERYDSLATAWWGNWLNIHGHDTLRHKAFLGYIYTNHIDHRSEPHVLDQAYSNYLAYVEASEAIIPGKNNA